MRRTNGVSAVGKGSFQRLTVSSVWIEFHVALRERVELTIRSDPLSTFGDDGDCAARTRHLTS